MRIKRWSCIFSGVLLVYIIACYYFWRIQISLDDSTIKQIARAAHGIDSDTDTSNAVTVILREFEDFENDIKDTVAHTMQVLPKSKIIVAADKLPYPPLHLPRSETIELINFNPLPNTNPSSMDAEAHVETPYVLLLPDGVRVGHASAVREMMLVANKMRKNSIVVASVLGEEMPCYKTNVSLRYWSVQNTQPDLVSLCNMFQGSVVLLVPSTLLFSMSYPLSRPFPYALFLQAGLKSVSIHFIESVKFQRGKKLFANAHLQWKQKTYHLQRLVALYRTFGVKKVVQANGEVEWHGCNKHTARCFGSVVDDMPDYLHSGRYTPPCCMEALRKTGRHVLASFLQSGVRHWLEGGSLLGAARSEDIIPWDYDIDIGIYQDDIAKSVPLTKAKTQPYVDEKGFMWEKAHEGDFFRVQYSKNNHMHVDVFPFTSRAGTMTKKHWFKTHPQDREFPEHFLHPLTTINFIGVKASAPNNIRDFLELKFGEGAIEQQKYPSVLQNVTLL